MGRHALDVRGSLLLSTYVNTLIEHGLVLERLSEPCAEIGAPELASPSVTRRSVWAEVVKLFPAFVGGPSYLKALRGPFPELKAIPSGSITMDALGDWFRAGAIAIGIGSELCSRELQNAGDWDEITRRARAFAGFEL